MIQESKLPEELALIAKELPIETKNEVQSVLNKVFEGVSKMKAQLDSIVVVDHNDKVNMKLANTIRLGVRNERLDAEKVFDAKRAEVQQKMIGYKTEDSLWLKSKQVMQILTKEIESVAKWKEETKERYEAEQKELKIQQRIHLVSKFSDISRIEFENMSDESFDLFLSGIEKQYNDRIEAEKKAELERVEKERLDKLENQRRLEIAPFVQFISESQDLRNMSDVNYQNLLQNLQKAKSDYEKEQEKIRLENEKLKEEKERIEKIRSKRAKELQPYIMFIRDYSKLINKPESEYKTEFSDIKKGAEDHWEFEQKEKIRIQKESEEAAEKIRIEKEKSEKLQKELDDKKAAEKLEIEKKNAEIEKQKKEAEKLAKAPVKKQLENWVNLFQSPLSPMEHEKVDLILEKFESFKTWAKSEIEKL